MDSTHISDELIVRAAGGDTESFEVIYRAFNRFVYQVAFRMVDDPLDAEEIVQDVFVRVFHQLRSFRFEASLKTWIYRITVNTTINVRKKRTRQRDKIKEYREEMHKQAQVTKPRYAEEEDAQNKVQQLLSILNDDQRLCLVLRVIEGLSYEEIARTLQININTVRTRLKRAREKLLSVKQEVVGDEV